MGDIRKKYDAALKAKIALEAVKGDKTIREISSEYGVHPNQIMKWKKQLLEELPSIFSDKRAKTEKEREDLEAKLYRQCELIGLPSSSYYYEAREESEYNLLLMRLIDEEYSRALFYDTRRMTVFGRIEIQYSGS